MIDYLKYVKRNIKAISKDTLHDPYASEVSTCYALYGLAPKDKSMKKRLIKAVKRYLHGD